MCDFENNNIPMRKVELVCSNCQADLMTGEAIDNVRTGVQKNTLVFNRQRNWFDSQENEFDSDGIYEEYTCTKCGADVSEVIKRYI